VRVSIDVANLDLPVHQETPLGLILNELMSNAFKHGFPGDRRGHVSVTLARLTGECAISCLDDGVGIPASFDWKNSGSLGLTITQILAKQLSGSLTLDHSHLRVRLSRAARPS